MPSSSPILYSKLSLRVVLWALLASFIVAVTLLWQVASSILAYQQEESRLRDLIHLSDYVKIGNDNLTHTSRMMALTGEPHWQDEYRYTKKVIKDHFAAIHRLAPSILAEQAEIIESTSDRLQDIEASSQLLMSKNYPQEAIDMLIGPEYTMFKNRLNVSLNELDSDIDAFIKKTESDRQQQLWWRLGLIAVMMTCLFTSWLFCLRLLSRWKTQVDEEVARRLIIEAELKQQKGFLDSIIQHLPLAVFAKDAKRNYEWIMWNRKAEELFGLKAETVIGTSDFDHFPHEEAEFFRQIDKKVMEGGQVVEVEAESITTSRGTWLGHTIKVPIVDETGTPTILLGILEDITVRKQQADTTLQTYADELEQKNDELEEARTLAEAADKAKTEFLATMSHEIRTPLNGVIGTADLLSRTQLSDNQVDYVRTIQKSGETLLYVINDILDITKLEAHQLGLEHIAFDLSLTIEDVVDIHSAAASKKELDMLLRYAPGTPTRIYGDPGRLRQILNNLIGNAIKFTDRGHILVSVESMLTLDRRTMLKIEISDTGIGIAPESQDKIFGRFTQAEASTTRKYGGTGLGLAICKQLVELMGGRMELESSVGLGSTFRMFLPAEVDAEPVQALPLTDLAGKKVMVVDDNTTNLNILQEQLDYWGCKPTLFTSADDAMSWLATCTDDAPFDAGILDHDMPEISGGMLGEMLRQHPLTASIPLMAFSSRGMRGDASYFADIGFNAYLVKPSRPEDIRTTLSAMFNHQLGTPIITRHTLGEQRYAAKPEPSKINLQILVVEDDPVNQRVIQTMLEELGCTVHVASNGHLAVMACSHTTFDLIFMDMQMPEMDGPETTRQLRAFEKENKRPRTPIVALTANAMAEHRELCMQAGMDDYTTKPVNREKLWEKLSVYIPDTLTAPPPSDGLTPEQLAQLDQIFRQTFIELIGKMEQAVLFEDTAQWTSAAHQMKGSAMNLGYTDIVELSRTAEANPDSLDKEQHLQALKDAFQALP